jgi:ABC-type nitrate/sulfonate/bicarbonate transport system permease component
VGHRPLGSIRKLFPSLVTVLEALVRLTLSARSGSYARTLVRLVLGFSLAAAVGVTLGIVMGRYRVMEDVFLPLVSIGYPIPGLAYAPLFVLWFGLGDLPAVLLVGIASSFAVTINTWKGVKGVKEIWVRAAEAMGANDRQMFS